MWIVISLIQIFLIFLTTVVFGGMVVVTKFFFGVRNYPYLVKNAWAPCILKVSGVKIKVNGHENINDNEPCIFVANHQSHFDIPSLISGLSPTLFFIAKKELKKVPFLGWAMTSAGLIFIDRSNKDKAIESLTEAAKLIKNGKSILSFPEGTRSKNGEIGSFKRGTFILAKQAEVKIIPIAISGSYHVNPSNSIRIKSGVVSINIGKAIGFDAYKDFSPDAIATQIQQQIIELSREQTNQKELVKNLQF